MSSRYDKTTTNRHEALIINWAEYYIFIVNFVAVICPTDSRIQLSV